MCQILYKSELYDVVAMVMTPLDFSSMDVII